MTAALKRGNVSEFSIAMPTRNAARHIDLILEFYTRHGLPLNVFVDETSTDDTLAICRRAGHRVTVVHNPLGRMEGMFKQMADGADHDWVLRMDDDELPSLAMIEQARALTTGPIDRQYAFRLIHLALANDEGAVALGAYEDPPHDQVRLFHRQSVAYDSRIHTPGFHVTQRDIRSPDACFAHLQWIVRSLEERRAKIADYDRQAPGAGSNWRDYYLLEDNQPIWSSAYRVDRAEWRETLSALRQRFPQAIRLAPMEHRA
jgi:glycosyltransferase involved in cell wall biosynthesis